MTLLELKAAIPSLRWKQEGEEVFFAESTVSLSWWRYLSTEKQLEALSFSEALNLVEYMKEEAAPFWYPPHEWKSVSIRGKCQGQRGKV